MKRRHGSFAQSNPSRILQRNSEDGGHSFDDCCIGGIGERVLDSVLYAFITSEVVQYVVTPSLTWNSHHGHNFRKHPTNIREDDVEHLTLRVVALRAGKHDAHESGD